MTRIEMTGIGGERDDDSRVRDIELAATDKPSGGGISEDWAATLVGLGLVLLALFGLIPSAVLW